MNAMDARNSKKKKHHIMPALFVAAAVLAGCGSEITTNPLATGPQDFESPVGEVLLPGPTDGISTPKELSATYAGQGTMLLEWGAPSRAYEAIILRDGAEIGRVPAQDGTFEDTLPLRTPGVVQFSYTVCFGRGTQVGPEAQVVVEIPRLVGGEAPPAVDFVD